MYATTLCTFSRLFSSPATRRGVRIRAGLSTYESESVRVDSGRKSRSLYDILRVKRTASQMEVKSAYRRSLAKVHHPDVSGDDDDREQRTVQNLFKICNAYRTLSDPATRATYDLSLDNSRISGRGPVGYRSTRRWETDLRW